MTTTIVDPHLDFDAALDAVIEENARLSTALNAEEWKSAGQSILGARSVFVIGSGRSGLASQAAAMRLMHLGLVVHVAGEVTAPAIAEGDVLIAVSGSGSTASVVAAADTAHSVGALVVAVTITPSSRLASTAEHVLTIPAADKQDHGNETTVQYAGSLFEQSVFLAFDALFHSLWRSRPQSAESLWSRHANIG